MRKCAKVWAPVPDDSAGSEASGVDDDYAQAPTYDDNTIAEEPAAYDEQAAADPQFNATEAVESEDVVHHYAKLGPAPDAAQDDTFDQSDNFEDEPVHDIAAEEADTNEIDFDENVDQYDDEELDAAAQTPAHETETAPEHQAEIVAFRPSEEIAEEPDYSATDDALVAGSPLSDDVSSGGEYNDERYETEPQVAAGQTPAEPYGEQATASATPQAAVAQTAAATAVADKWSGFNQTSTHQQTYTPSPEIGPSEQGDPYGGFDTGSNGGGFASSVSAHADKHRTGKAMSGVAMSCWIMFAVFVGSITALVTYGRETLVRVLPAAGSFYQMAGIPVNVNSFEIKGVRIKWAKNQNALIVSGAVRNIADKDREVPSLVFDLRDSRGDTLFKWAAPTTSGAISKGEQIRFSERIPAPPKAVRTVRVRFARAN